LRHPCTPAATLCEIMVPVLLPCLLHPRRRRLHLRRRLRVLPRCLRFRRLPKPLRHQVRPCVPGRLRRRRDEAEARADRPRSGPRLRGRRLVDAVRGQLRSRPARRPRRPVRLEEPARGRRPLRVPEQTGASAELAAGVALLRWMSRWQDAPCDVRFGARLAFRPRGVASNCAQAGAPRAGIMLLALAEAPRDEGFCNVFLAEGLCVGGDSRPRARRRLHLLRVASFPWGIVPILGSTSSWLDGSLGRG